MVSILPSAATVRRLPNFRLATGSPTLQARDVSRTGRPRERSVVAPYGSFASVSFAEGPFPLERTVSSRLSAGHGERASLSEPIGLLHIELAMMRTCRTSGTGET